MEIMFFEVPWILLLHVSIITYRIRHTRRWRNTHWSQLLSPLWSTLDWFLDLPLQSPQSRNKCLQPILWEPKGVLSSKEIRCRLDCFAICLRCSPLKHGDNILRDPSVLVFRIIASQLKDEGTLENTMVATSKSSLSLSFHNQNHWTHMKLGCDWFCEQFSPFAARNLCWPRGLFGSSKAFKRTKVVSTGKGNAYYSIKPL